MRLIDADAFMKEIAHIDLRTLSTKTVGEAIDLCSIEAEPVRHGEWLPDPVVPDGRHWLCSECRTSPDSNSANRIYRYCPRCGARMDRDGITRSDKVAD